MDRDVLGSLYKFIAAQLVGGEVSVPERHGQGAVAEDSP
jgi:hypothetical protein